MRRGVALWTGCAMLLGGVALANARGAHDLSDEELRSEMSQNKALAVYVARNGEPDLAEAHFLADRPPWDDHEVTLYYLDARKEIGFARAWILGRPEIALQRYERPLTDEQVAMLSTRTRKTHAPATGLGPDARAEDAARRAENAAGRVEAAADAAEHAADRAEAIATKAVSVFHQSLRK
jgi:hypothetical protein